MHKSPTELTQSAQWGMATALRLGATPDAGHVRAISGHPFHPFSCKYWGDTLRRPIEQGATQTWSATSLCDWVQKHNDAAREMRCAILDVVSWFLSVLQLWIEVSVR